MYAIVFYTQLKGADTFSDLILRHLPIFNPLSATQSVQPFIPECPQCPSRLNLPYIHGMSRNIKNVPGPFAGFC